MARNKHKRLNKLRRYRDQLLLKITNLEGHAKHHNLVMHEIRKALAKDDSLRAYALASDEEGIWSKLKGTELVEIMKELALAYRTLNIERKYTAEIGIAARQRDYLRVAALAETLAAEVEAHDRVLADWSKDHGFTRSLRKELKDENVA